MRLLRAIAEFRTFLYATRPARSARRGAWALKLLGEVVHNKDVRNIGPRDIEKFLVYCRELKHSNNTIAGHLGPISTFWLRWLIPRGDADAMPIQPIHRPRRRRTLIARRITDQDWGKIEGAVAHIKILGETRKFAPGILALLRYCGLRNSEARNARVENLDLERCELKVLGKGSKPRVCPIPGVAIPALVAAKQRADRLKSPWLFRSARGKQPIGEAGLHRLWKKLLRHAGLLESIRIHDARHSFAVKLLESGVNLRVVQILLGHAHIGTTQHYLQVYEADIDKRRAVDRVFALKNKHPELFEEE